MGFFAKGRKFGSKNIIIDIKSIKVITYPKITLVIVRYAIAKERDSICFHEILFSLKFLINKKDTRLIKNNVKHSVTSKGSISKTGKYSPSMAEYKNEFLGEE